MRCSKQIFGFYLLVLSFLFTHTQTLFSQESSYILNRTYDNLDWENFVSKVEHNFPVHFYYEKDSMPSFRTIVQADSVSLLDALKENLMPMSIYVTIDKLGHIFVTKNSSISSELPVSFFDSQKEKTSAIEATQKSSKKEYLHTRSALIVATIVVGDPKKGAYIREVVMSGYVSSRTDGSRIPGATLYIPELSKGVSADANGFYSIKLKKGNYLLAVSSVQSEEAKYNLQVYSDAQINFSLNEKVNTLNEVAITAGGNSNVKGTTMGVDQISMKEVKKIPRMMGENDIIKTTLLLPGVQSVGEGTAGYNVRGGSADQNMFYLNQIPVYNTSHLLGFFTAFPPNGISSLTLYKSNFPAQFGGHLSSIFDITAKQGDKTKFLMRGGLTPLTVDLLAEGPIQKDKGSYMVAVRSMYLDLLLKIKKMQEFMPLAFDESSLAFRDVLVNVSNPIGKKDKINFTAYYSLDNIHIAPLVKVAYNFQNTGSSAKWIHTINEKHSLDISGIYSKYSYLQKDYNIMFRTYKINYGLEHIEGKANLHLAPIGKHQLNFGINSITYLLDQGSYKPLDSSRVVPVTLSKEQGIESGAYVQDKWDISSALSIDLGVRYNMYNYLGPKKSFIYQAGSPHETKNIIDSIYYSSRKIIKTYSAPDFRFGLRYAFNDTKSIKASFNQVHQYIFMLSNTIAISPSDKWKLCDNYIEPMRGEQYSLGLFSNSKNLRYEFSVEGYYKRVHKLVEYKDGASLMVNKIPEADVLQGKLDAYGVEFMMKKKKGRVNGWVSYTYSRAIVQVNGLIDEEKTNFGNPYPANFDKPHALNVVFNYDLSHTFSLASNVIYSTGRPITYPTSIFFQNGIPILNYSTRNEYRIPNYFRVDLSVNVEGNLKAKKLLHGSWSFSIYNLLGRANPYSIYFKQENGLINGYQLSIFARPIFSISYNFKFGTYEN